MANWDPSFKLPRIGLLQPAVTPDQLDTPVQGSSEQLVLDSYGNVVRLWADSHSEIPIGRLEGKFSVTSAARQVVSLVTVHKQVINRRVEQREEPASRSTADARPLPSGTPLNMVPIEKVAFPDKAESSTHRLPGGESIQDCAGCRATGHNACRACGETGRVACGTCGGTKLLRCRACNGVGLMRYPNGFIANCPTCLTAGTRSCTSCGPDGQIQCSRCTGEGFITCGPCGGYGKICRFHALISEVSTLTESYVIAAEEWNLDVAGLSESMSQIWAEDVPLTITPSGKPAAFSVEQYVPAIAPNVVKRLHSTLNKALSQGSADSKKAQTARALRFQIRSCYVHRVGYKLDGGGSEDSVYIGGLDNRIAPGVLLERCSTSTAWVQRGFRGILRTIGLVEDNGLSKTFKKRLKTAGGQIHMLDTDTTVADAIQKAGMTLSVLDMGYEVLSGDDHVATIEFTPDEAKGSLIVGFASTIGPAFREKFVAALQMNKNFALGRLALTVDASTGALEFKLVDVRLYSDIDANTYKGVLAYLLNVARPHALSTIKG